MGDGIVIFMVNLLTNSWIFKEDIRLLPCKAIQFVMIRIGDDMNVGLLEYNADRTHPSTYVTTFGETCCFNLQ